MENDGKHTITKPHRRVLIGGEDGKQQPSTNIGNYAKPRNH